MTVPASPEARAFAERYYKYLTDASLQDRVVIQPNPVRKMPGGFERIPIDGFHLLGSGLVTSRSTGQRTEDFMRPISAEKLVYSIV